MSKHIRVAAGPTQARLRRCLKDIPCLPEITSKDPEANQTEYIKYIQKATLSLAQLSDSLNILEETNKTWLQIITDASEDEYDEEYKAYEEMSHKPENLIDDIENAREALLTLQFHKEEAEAALSTITEALKPQGNTVTPQSSVPTPKQPSTAVNSLSANSLIQVSTTATQQPTTLQSQNNNSPASPPPSTVPQPIPLATIPTRLSPIQLPKLRLLEFTGSYKEWPAFWSTFQKAIDLQPLPDITKLTYLMSVLKGDARNTITGFTLRPENYAIIVQTLKDRYAQQGRLRAELHRELQAIHPVARQSDLPMVWRQLQTVLRQLEALGENTEQSLIETAIETKLPLSLLKEIYKLKMTESTWSVTKLRNFVNQQVQFQEQAQAAIPFQKPENRDHQQPSTHPFNRSYKKPPHPHSTSDPRPISTMAIQQKQQQRQPRLPKSKCAFCNELHYNDQCSRYRTLKERLERVKQLKLCARCLRIGHFAANCQIKLRPCFYYKGAHTGALCNKRQSNFKPAAQRPVAVHTSLKTGSGESAEAENEAEEESTITMTNTGTEKEGILLMCREVMVHNPQRPENQEEVLVFFDCGSERSYMDEELGKRLEVPLKSQRTLLISTFGALEPKKIPTREAQISVKLVDGKEKLLQLQTVGYMTQKMLTAQAKQGIKISGNSEAVEKKWKKPEVLIGADYFFDFVKSVESSESGFHIIKTSVGPVLAGRSIMSRPKRPPQIASYMATDVNQFWELDAIGVTDANAESEDQCAYNSFQNSIIREPTGRYAVKWPWRDVNQELSNNVGLCLGRLRSLLTKLRSQPHLLNEYDKIFKDQFKSGIIELAPKRTEALTNFLPHQAVITPHKATTKLRVVFDASAKGKSGLSLNEALYRGPVILPQLCGVLLRARSHRSTIVADVEKAFLQISLQEKDRDVTRFFWIKDLLRPPEGDNLVVFRYARVLFGVVSSPFLLAAVLQHHLEHEESWLAEDIKKNLYVDNVLIGADEEETTWDIYVEAKRLFKSAHMNLRNFTSTSKRCPRYRRKGHSIPIHRVFNPTLLDFNEN